MVNINADNLNPQTIIESFSICVVRPGLMATLFKAYAADNDKNGESTTNKFEGKFLIFMERCDRS